MLNSEFSSVSSAMLAAVQEARKWLGATSPNPSVGATALDEKGVILAVAAHHRAGGDHAEAAVLKLCREQGLLPRIHTLCVTLEPCNHYGRTPPCSEAIIAAGVRRVVVGTRDPNPAVKGGGIEHLRQAGIEVIEGVETEACRRLIHAFAFHSLSGKPFVTVKRAFDAGGSMIPSSGSKTFTSKESLILAHSLRKKADAIITGSGTILADKPLFTVRHVPDYADKRRILAIFDRRGRTSKEYIAEAAARGLDAEIHQNIDSCLSSLEKRGIRDILVESGPILSESILESPHWTMKVDIYKGEPDKVDLSFNKATETSFDMNGLAIYSLLPL